MSIVPLDRICQGVSGVEVEYSIFRHDMSRIVSLPPDVQAYATHCTFAYGICRSVTVCTCVCLCVCVYACVYVCVVVCIRLLEHINDDLTQTV